jgi:hypothetical protein
MPTTKFRDWSPPVCSLVSWSRGWSYRGDTLYKYTLTPRVRCSKKCSLKVFASKRLNNRDDIYKGVNGRNIEVPIVQAQTETALQTISTESLDFGLITGDMWLQITADDGKGNTAKSSHFVEIPAVAGMRKIG